jgi:hypothetical protein
LLKEFYLYANRNIGLLKDIPITEKKRRIENNFHKNCILVVAEHGVHDIIKNGTTSQMHEVINRYREKIPTLRENYDNVLFHYFNNQVFVMTFVDENTKIENLLSLISKKNSNLASNRRHNSHNDIDLPFEEDSFYILDYSDESILNRKNIFSLVTDLTLSGHTINYDYAFIKLKEIEASLSSNSKDELLNW